MLCRAVPTHTYISARISRAVCTGAGFIAIARILKPTIAPHGLGGEYADNLETGSRSAVAGGTTAMFTSAPQSRSERDRCLVGVLEAYKNSAVRHPSSGKHS